MNNNPISPAEFQSHRRLACATAIAAVVICGTIVMLPLTIQWQQQTETSDPIELQLVPAAKDDLPEEPVMDESPKAEPVEKIADNSLSTSEPEVVIDSSLNDPPALSAPAVDLHAAMQKVIKSDNLFVTPTMHPELDEQRRVARIRFRKSNAPVKKEIWDNVEKDQMGRTILRAGDCHRVLDDPSVANQWLHENFTQYMIFCSNGKTSPKALPFVAEIVERYAYLKPDDGVEKSEWQ
jgi:hypothetical protein